MCQEETVQLSNCKFLTWAESGQPMESVTRNT